MGANSALYTTPVCPVQSHFGPFWARSELRLSMSKTAIVGTFFFGPFTGRCRKAILIPPSSGPIPKFFE